MPPSKFRPKTILQLKPLTASDVETIKQWPSYPPWASQLDYALRNGGWLDQFPNSDTTRRFAFWKDSELVGFSVLTDITKDSAEFYIAIHPDQLGTGIGKELTTQVIRTAFDKLRLKRVYLKVRGWHHRAIHVYERVGFKKEGTCVSEIQGKPVSFITMSIENKANV